MRTKSPRRRNSSWGSLFMSGSSLMIVNQSIKIPFFSITAMSITGNGMEMIAVGVGCRSGKMDPFMRDIGKITLPMGMDASSIQMEMCISGNGRMIVQMEKVHKF